MTSTTFGSAQQLATDLLTAAGVPGERARCTARCIVLADAWGIGSHGLLRLPYYLHRIEAGGHPATAQLRVVNDSGPVLALDGGGGLGHWQLWSAAESAVTRCRDYGIAAVSVANSGHCGALGVYTMPGNEAGYLTLAFSNGPAVMPAWGGAQALLSTSPFAAGIPTRPQPTIVDMALSTVARGKIAAHANRDEQLPPGWALDSEGRPTIDPHEALNGLLAPLGGAKGFALALVVEAMAGGLAGPNLSTDVADMFAEADNDRPQRIGHLLIMLDPTRFSAPEDGIAVRARLDRLAESVLAGGGRLPGARRAVPAEDAPIEVGDKTIDELAAWAGRLRVGI